MIPTLDSLEQCCGGDMIVENVCEWCHCKFKTIASLKHIKLFCSEECSDEYKRQLEEDTESYL